MEPHPIQVLKVSSTSLITHHYKHFALLEWVQGEFADSVDTVEGRFQHRRVDRPSGKLPSRPVNGAADPAEDADAAHETIHARSVLVSDESLGAISRIDLIEGRGNVVTPVDYKHGKTPEVPEGAWEPERVQVCIQDCCSAPTAIYAPRECSIS